MYIRPILTVFSLLFYFGAFAANIDSTGVQNNKGKKLIIHKVEPKETYYSLARKYGVDPKSIMEFNNNIPLQIGTIINIPTDRPFADDNTAQKTEGIPQRNTVKAKPTYVTHKVRPKETLSEIAEKYDTSVKTIQNLNNMKGTSIQIGKVLKVRKNEPVEPKTETPAAVVARVSTSAATNDAPVEEVKSEAPKVNTNHYGLREQNERGIATWIEDENVDGTKLLVLHRTAPIGTVMKITNPMTDKSTFAKVVGKFTENESTKDVLIVITKAVADLIGALDKRFQVNIDYGLSE
ncbi:MAG TPA: peptidoglycan-binding protein [Sphingobacteriaceae bacterium]|nr:peptidoglycan-binding protein [Sphingobacteriaceae bacterium]